MTWTWPERLLAVVVGLCTLITVGLLIGDLVAGVAVTDLGGRLDTLAIDAVFAWGLSGEIRGRRLRLRLDMHRHPAPLAPELAATLQPARPRPRGGRHAQQQPYTSPVVDHVEPVGHPSGGSTDR